LVAELVSAHGLKDGLAEGEADASGVAADDEGLVVANTQIASKPTTQCPFRASAFNIAAKFNALSRSPADKSMSVSRRRTPTLPVSPASHPYGVT
jgi:hypothetical protein